VGERRGEKSQPAGARGRPVAVPQLNVLSVAIPAPLGKNRFITGPNGRVPAEGKCCSPIDRARRSLKKEK